MILQEQGLKDFISKAGQEIEKRPGLRGAAKVGKLTATGAKAPAYATAAAFAPIISIAKDVIVNENFMKLARGVLKTTGKVLQATYALATAPKHVRQEFKQWLRYMPDLRFRIINFWALIYKQPNSDEYAVVWYDPKGKKAAQTNVPESEAEKLVGQLRGKVGEKIRQKAIKSPGEEEKERKEKEETKAALKSGSVSLTQSDLDKIKSKFAPSKKEESMQNMITVIFEQEGGPIDQAFNRWLSDKMKEFRSRDRFMKAFDQNWEKWRAEFYNTAKKIAGITDAMLAANQYTKAEHQKKTGKLPPERQRELAAKRAKSKTTGGLEATKGRKPTEDSGRAEKKRELMRKGERFAAEFEDGQFLPMDDFERMKRQVFGEWVVVIDDTITELTDIEASAAKTVDQAFKEWIQAQSQKYPKDKFYNLVFRSTDAVRKSFLQDLRDYNIPDEELRKYKITEPLAKAEPKEEPAKAPEAPEPEAEPQEQVPAKEPEESPYFDTIAGTIRANFGSSKSEAEKIAREILQKEQPESEEEAAKMAIQHASGTKESIVAPDYIDLPDESLLEYDSYEFENEVISEAFGLPPANALLAKWRFSIGQKGAKVKTTLIRYRLWVLQAYDRSRNRTYVAVFDAVSPQNPIDTYTYEGKEEFI